MKINNYCTFKNGKTFRKNLTGPYPIYGSTGIIGSYPQKIIEDPARLIVRVGANCGLTQYITKPGWVSDNTIICLPKFNNNIRFVYYLLSSLNLNKNRIGSSQPLLTIEILNNTEVYEYSIQQQCHTVDTI